MFSGNKGFTIPLILGTIFCFSALFVSAGLFEDIKIPEKTIIIKFKEASPMPKSMPIYYKGLKVGSTVSQEFSEDYQYTLIKARIDKKDFNPPNNIYAEVKYETQAQVRGTKVNLNKYLELIYPENPSKEALKDEDTIEGHPSFINEMQDAVKGSVGKKDVKSAINSVMGVAEEAKKVSEQLNEIARQVNDFLAQNRPKFDEIVENSRNVTGNASYVSGVIRGYSAKPIKEPGMQRSLGDVSLITENLAKTTYNVSEITKDIQCITGNPHFRCGVINSTANVSKISEYLDYSLKYGDIKAILQDTDRAINRFDCFEEGLTDMLSQRFLLLRMIFGKPGKFFDRCQGPCPQYMYRNINQPYPQR